VCLCVNQKGHIACNFDCHVEPEGRLKVIGSHIHCKCGNISETEEDSDVAVTEH